MKGYVTFGPDHRHPITGEDIGDRFVTILGEDLIQIRYVAFATFGHHWSMLYTNEEYGKAIEKWGLIEIPLPEPCCNGIKACKNEFCPFDEETIEGLDELEDAVLQCIMMRARQPHE